MKNFLFYSSILQIVFLQAYTSEVSQKDFQQLERFFDYLIHHSTIGYTLCGEKPVSIEQFYDLSKIPLPFILPAFFKRYTYSIERNGWNTWKQYAHLFSSKHFAFRFIAEYNILVIINKKAAKKVIEKNLDLFQKDSNSNLTANNFLEDLCHPKRIEYISARNPILLGILLGFGRNNAIAFTNRSPIQKLVPLHFSEWNRYLSTYLIPGCMVIDHKSNEKENKKIVQCFRNAQSNLQKAFKEKHYFETFVKLFTDGA
ncbi:hypothetical protein [Parachlamydia acanthamoebae]|uniref:hypothetical protein n=1 Tax=Parachlamydia acanthamoebae TaxID=83552 RepID=UPI000750A409|nr:hypothetical protein [Parachlamydia acanthamoebae]